MRGWTGWLGYMVLAVTILTVSVQSWRAPVEVVWGYGLGDAGR